MRKRSKEDYYDRLGDRELRESEDYYLEQKNPKSDALLQFLDWLRTFLFVVLLGLFITLFVIQRNTISGPSMEPTLHDKDQIFVEKISKHFRLDRSDIITIDESDPEHPNNLLIKRIVGLPGETVEIKNGVVYINGKVLGEHYIPNDISTNADPVQDHQFVTLKEDEYYVLGDNRPVSKDSRRIGPVHKDQIIGKLLIRFYPFEDFGKPK